MEKLRIHVCGTDVHVTQLGKLTTGMVGATASFSFSPEWNGLLKTAVFCSGIKKDVILTGDTVKIPPECIRTPALTVGVYGHLADGTVVIPTVMSERIEVAAGTKPSGDTQSGFTPDKWMQLLGMIGDLSMLTTDEKANLVAAINEAARKGGGAVDPAEIQRIVTEYLAANPPTVKETDPTVPAWAKQPQKPSYTAAEVGALSQNQLQSGINTALAQAKASGEFDGADGKDGKDGSDGYTPQKGVDYFDGQPGTDGKDGADGKNGTSVTVKSVSESAADGGSNVVTFSDGKTLTVRNGSKGSPGEKGDKGDKGDPGDDYVLTTADKEEIAQLAAGIVDTALLALIGTGEVTA